MRPLPYEALRRFVIVDGWVDKDAGRPTGDHHRYYKDLHDGRRLWTRISLGRGEYGDPKLVHRILRHELEVTEEEFWAAVQHGVVPNRDDAASPSAADQPSLPAGLVRQLISKVGVPENEIATFTHDWAVWVWEYWAAFQIYPPPDTIGDWTAPS